MSNVESSLGQAPDYSLVTDVLLQLALASWELFLRRQEDTSVSMKLRQQKLTDRQVN